MFVMVGISFYLLCLYYSSPIWDCVEISAFPHVPFASHMIVRDSRDSTVTPTDAHIHLTVSCVSDASLLWWLWPVSRTLTSRKSGLSRSARPCCATICNTGGTCVRPRSYIDFTNFCHFLRNKLSRYCFFNCNRCSLRLNNGHLFIFRATFIFLHRASKALSRAANSFMLVSWSRLLRNIHS